MLRRIESGVVPRGARFVRVTALPALFETWAREWLAEREFPVVPARGELGEFAGGRLG